MDNWIILELFKSFISGFIFARQELKLSKVKSNEPSKPLMSVAWGYVQGRGETKIN